MLKKLALAGLLLYSAHVMAAVETQAEILKKADDAAAQSKAKAACVLYKKAYFMGFKGDQLDPKQNKIFVRAAMQHAQCEEKTDDPMDYYAVGIYRDLKSNFGIKEAKNRLIEIQQEKLKEATTVLKSHNLKDFEEPSEQTNKACKSAEFGYMIGFLGEDEKKLDTVHAGYVSNGIYHATCMSLNPAMFINGDKQTSSVIAYSIIKDLAETYSSPFAAELIQSSQ